jgi:hypothetical protein
MASKQKPVHIKREERIVLPVTGLQIQRIFPLETGPYSSA